MSTHLVLVSRPSFLYPLSQVFKHESHDRRHASDGLRDTGRDIRQVADEDRLAVEDGRLVSLAMGMETRTSVGEKRNIRQKVLQVKLAVVNTVKSLI